MIDHLLFILLKHLIGTFFWLDLHAIVSSQQCYTRGDSEHENLLQQNSHFVILLAERSWYLVPNKMLLFWWSKGFQVLLYPPAPLSLSSQDGTVFSGGQVLQTGGDTNYKSINKPWTLCLDTLPVTLMREKVEITGNTIKAQRRRWRAALTPPSRVAALASPLPLIMIRKRSRLLWEGAGDFENEKVISAFIIKTRLELLPHDRDVELNHNRGLAFFWK